MKSFLKKILIGCDNVICLEGFEIFSKERFIKISTHEIKKEGGEVEEVDDDDISITTL